MAKKKIVERIVNTIKALENIEKHINKKKEHTTLKINLLNLKKTNR